jgi:hypothetical protein
MPRDERPSDVYSRLDIVRSWVVWRIACDLVDALALVDAHVVNTHGRREDEVLEIRMLKSRRHAKIDNDALPGET